MSKTLRNERSESRGEQAKRYADKHLSHRRDRHDARSIAREALTKNPTNGKRFG